MTQKKIDNWEKLLDDFATWIWQLSPHNFNGSKYKFGRDDFIKFRLEPLVNQAEARGEKKERERWINQKANAHDEAIRKAERERIKEWARENWHYLECVQLNVDGSPKKDFFVCKRDLLDFLEKKI